MHLLGYQFKLLVRDKILLFWTLIFPIILATFFNLAFSNLTSSENFDLAKVAIVENQENQEFKELVTSLSTKGEDQLLEVQYVNQKEAKKLLEEDEIDGYLVINEKIELTVKNSGISETIIQTVVDNFYQVTSTMNHIAQLNPSAFATGVLNDLGLDRDNFHDISNENTDLTVIYFYTLIGMTCLYGSFWGLKTSTIIEANLSRQGTRVNMAPTSKIKVLLAGFTIAFMIQGASMILLMLYLNYGLGISFGDQTALIGVLIAVGNVVGIALGSIVGNIFRTSENTKITILTSTTMALSFLSGMMVVDIKYFILENIPIAAYINPVSLITDALYSLYYYTNNDRYYFNILCLAVIGIVLLGISLVLMRKKKYDSI